MRDSLGGGGFLLGVGGKGCRAPAGGGTGWWDEERFATMMINLDDSEVSEDFSFYDIVGFKSGRCFLVRKTIDLYVNWQAVHFMIWCLKGLWKKYL